MTNEGLTIEEVTRILLQRVRNWMPVRTIPDIRGIPALPATGLVLPMREDFNPCSCSCQRDTIIYLPVVLVVPRIHIYEAEAPGGYYVPGADFDSYFLGPVMVLHEGHPEVDRKRWRPMTVVETTEGLCEYPWVGSLRSVYENHWHVQVYHRDGHVVMDLGGTPQGHHEAWVPVKQRDTPPTYLFWRN